ncbi:MAG: class I SAM-dependent methyltransferase [Candidatus Limnocylindrales bacterium]
MTFEPGIRRTPPDDEPLPDSDPVLMARLRAAITTGGPLTFARFMELALTDREHGYYATSHDRPTRSGDFLTAPELHPIFGATIARSLEEQWQLLGRPDPYLLREYGAGSGTLAEDILRALERDGSQLLEAIAYTPIELMRDREARIRDRLATAGFARAVAGDSRGSGDRGDRAGTILANEFLDALPVHRVERRNGRLVELYVDWSAEDGGRFAEAPAEPSTPLLARRLAAEEIELAEGQRAEVNLAIDTWVTEALPTLDRGFAIVLDYGSEAAALHAPNRMGGTLRAYTAHRAHGDPFVAVGRQDLTAHVDFTAVERAAAAAGWRTFGLTSQAEFLVGSGLGEIIAARMAAPDLELAGGLALRAAVARLLDPNALGGFRVLVLGRGLPEETTLNGLGYRVRR